MTLTFDLSRSPSNRLLRHDLESMCFKFGKNRMKTFWFIVEQPKSDYLTLWPWPLTLTSIFFLKHVIWDESSLPWWNDVYMLRTHCVRASQTCLQTNKQTDRHTDRTDQHTGKFCKNSPVTNRWNVTQRVILANRFFWLTCHLLWINVFYSNVIYSECSYYYIITQIAVSLWVTRKIAVFDDAFRHIGQ